MSEEMIDVLDADEKRTGRILSKDDIHRIGEWHRTVHVWIITSLGQLIIQRRGERMETYPNCWDITSAGHVDAGETNIEAAIREIHEELGLEVSHDALEFLGTVHTERFYKQGTYINREHQDVYLVVQDIALDRLTLQKSEVAELQFMHWLEVRRHILEEDSEFVPHDQEYKLLFSLLEQRFPHANPSRRH